MPAVARRARPPGEMGGDTARALPDRGGRPRPGARARIGVAPRRDDHRARDAFTRDHGAFPTSAGPSTLNTINHLPARTACRTIGRAATTSSPTRRSSPPIAARAVPRRRSCSTDCSTAAARALGIDPGRAAAAQPHPPRRDAVRVGPHLPRRRADQPTTRRLRGRVRRLLERARLRGLAQGAGRAAGAARGRSASASRRTSRAPGSARSRAPTCASIRDGHVFVDVGVWRAGPGARDHARADLRRPARRAGRRVVVRGGDTDRVGFGMGTIASRVAAVAGPAVARSAARGRATRRGWSPPRCSSARPRTSSLAEGDVWRRGRARPEPARSARWRAPRVRSRALADGRRPRAQRVRVLLSGQRHLGLRRPGHRGRGRPRDVRGAVLRHARRARLRPADQPDGRGGPAARRHRAGDRQRAARGGRPRRGGPAPHRHVHGLRAAARRPTSRTLDVVHVEFPSTVNELGIKGVGESGVISRPSAGPVEGRGLDGIGPRDHGLPRPPSRVFEALRAPGRWPRPS